MSLRWDLPEQLNALLDRLILDHFNVCLVLACHWLAGLVGVAHVPHLGLAALTRPLTEPNPRHYRPFRDAPKRSQRRRFIVPEDPSCSPPSHRLAPTKHAAGFGAKFAASPVLIGRDRPHAR